MRKGVGEREGEGRQRMRERRGKENNTEKGYLRMKEVCVKCNSEREGEREKEGERRDRERSRR